MQIPNPIKVFLIDDSEIQSEGLRLLLSQDKSILVNGCSKSSKEVLHNKDMHQSDVVIFDNDSDTNSDAFTLIKSIQELNPQLKIIVLSYHKDINYIIQSIHAGASAYLAKDITISHLIQVIDLTMRGNGFFLGETIPKSVLTNCFKTPIEALHTNARPWNLTQREIEIIGLLSKGLITKEIAEKLKISCTTVDSHKENIKQKLNCKTVVGVVVFALKNGLIS
ncbi:MAG: LuxR C-terminal-related transcriptional regulator [Paludibacteraceae bacterium]